MLILSCSSSLGTCCTYNGLVQLISIIRNIMDIIQIVVPIMLIVMLSVQLTKMMINPEGKKNNKSLFNKLLAAIIVFFIPVIVNAVLGMLPNSYQLSACWDKAEKINMKTGNVSYVSTDERKKQTLIANPDDYEKGEERKSEEITSDNTEIDGNYLGEGVEANFPIKGSPQGQEIVKYALQFVGAKYVRGRAWNGKKEDYRGTDCFNFVDGLYKHFGYDLNWHDINRGIGNYEYVSLNDIRAGDIAYYNGHGAMFTGNGEQIIHAMSPKLGVRLSKTYHGGGHLLHVVRVKGVN